VFTGHTCYPHLHVMTGTHLLHTSLMKHFLTFILLFIGTSILACDCKTIRDLKAKQEREYKSSELIFIGIAIESDIEGKHFVEIIELLKGAYTKKTIEVNSNAYCIVVPRVDNDFYLIYSTKNKDGTITIDACGLTRSLESPYLLNEGSDVFPPPPQLTKFMDDSTMATIEYEKIRMKHREKALDVLAEEIKELRRKRDK